MSRGRQLLARALMLAPRPLVWRFARVYIAGETLEDALEAIRQLNSEGCRVTLDVLGEGATDHSQVESYVGEYQRAVAAIAEHGLDANVSVKPTAIGLKLALETALGAAKRILDAAAEHGMWVRLDMEDSSVTQATLDLYRRLRAEGYAKVGVVLQAYLRRTLSDARELAREGASVRLCKGIYVEPRELAYQDPAVVRSAFVDALEALLRAEGTYVGIATHDESLVLQGRRLVCDLAVPRERYEFQMLLGVDAQLRHLLVQEGHPLRVYVPYGKGWHAYSMRRLIENPRLAGHVLRNVLGYGPGA